METSSCSGRIGESRSTPKAPAGGRVMLMLGVVLAFTPVLTLGTCAGAFADMATPLAAVRSSIDQTVRILHDQQMPVEQRRRELRELAERNLDLARMARAALGDKWSQLSESQRAEFVPLFAAFIEAAYLDQIQDYAKLRIDVSTESLADPDHARVSATVLQPGEEPIPIIFMLENSEHRWIVYDVAVSDISMVDNYRAQFERVIRSQGIGALMVRLKQKRAQLEALLGQPSAAGSKR